MSCSLWANRHRFRIACAVASERPSRRPGRCIERLCRNGGSGQDQYRCEFRVVHPQRGTRWLVELGRLLRTPAGNAVCMTGITLDVTHRKQAEQERRAPETFKG